MDPRIKVALKAIEIMEKLQHSKLLRSDFHRLTSKVRELQWITDLDYLKKECDFFEKFPYDSLKFDSKINAEMKWCTTTLKKLKSRFEKGKSESILIGLDVGVGEIITTSKVSDNLTVCRISSKIGDFTVITNLKVKKGNRLPFVILPPTIVGGVMSEAMFVWGPIKSLDEIDWKKVEGTVSAFF